MSTPEAVRHRNCPVPAALLGLSRLAAGTEASTERIRDVETYEFRVEGHLDDHWSACFENVTIACHDDGTTTLTGPIADQAQLHGVLARFRDIGVTLLSLRRLDDNARTELEKLP
jgi:hypothetical protein